MKILLERNMLIFLMSICLFYFLFFTPKGIVKNYYDFTVKNHTLQREIYSYETKLKLLHKKNHHLKSGNKDLIEELRYSYFNKDPYNTTEKKILCVNNENSKKI